MDSEQKGQIYILVSIVDVYPKSQSFCNVCGKFPARTSQGELSYDLLGKRLTMVFLEKFVGKKSGQMGSSIHSSRSP